MSRQSAGTILRCAVPARVPIAGRSALATTKGTTRRRASTSSSSSSTSGGSAAETGSASSSSQTLARQEDRGRGSTLFDPPVEKMRSKMSELLEPLGIELGQAILERVLTHKSAASGKKGVPHAEKYAFIGRRVLRLHLTLHLMSKLSTTNPAATQQFVTNDSLSHLLDTNELGMHAARAIGLEQVLRWRQVRGPSGEPTGLFKARGAALEALIGAIHITNGIEASSRAFKQLVLPNMVLPKTLDAALNGPPPASASSPVEPAVEPERARATA